MGRHENGCTGSDFAAKELAYAERGWGVEAVGWLVEEEDAWSMDECAQEGELLLHAVRVRRCEGAQLLFEVEELDVLGECGPGGFRCEAACADGEVEGLAAGEEVVELWFVWGVADAFFDAEGVVGAVEAEDLCGACGGSEEAEEEFEGGGFAGAVGSEEANYFASAEFEVE